MENTCFDNHCYIALPKHTQNDSMLLFSANSLESKILSLTPMIKRNKASQPFIIVTTKLGPIEKTSVSGISATRPST